jgi:hypothetical protein
MHQDRNVLFTGVDINPFLPITVEQLSYLTLVTEIWILKYPLQDVSYLTLNIYEVC